MSSTSVSPLFGLPASERAELPTALWDSLTDVEREATLVLTPEREVALERRWAKQLESPASSVPWDEVHQKLQGQTSPSLQRLGLVKTRPSMWEVRAVPGR